MGVYLALNVVVIAVSLAHVVADPTVVSDWTTALTTQHGDPLMIVALSVLVFPKLALGMSGFETGVAVMTHVHGDEGDTEQQPTGRVRGTKRMLATAAGIMSVFLVTSSFVTTLLIPPAAFQEGGPASGRALAYLAHEYLGNGFGTVVRRQHDRDPVVRRRLGDGRDAEPDPASTSPATAWRRSGPARSGRWCWCSPSIAFLVTWIFDADVNAQGGAYATGVLVLFTSAGAAVSLAARRAGQRRLSWAFAVITLVFVYTTVDNVIERPDGVKIGACFIGAILAVSLASRLSRSFELRTTDVRLDATAELFVRDCARRTIRLVANEPDSRDRREYDDKLRQIRDDQDLPDDGDVVFVEVTVTDPSDFESRLDVRGKVMHGHHRVLSVTASSVPNALAALLLHVRDATGATPHIYFEWTEGNPAANFARFLLFGVGEVAPVTREVLRRAEPRRNRRPHVHVG